MARFVFSAFADEAGVTLSEQIDALKANGIRFIEPRNIDGRSIMSFSDEELYAIKAELDKNGIKVGSLGSPIGKYPITDDFESYMDTVRRALEIAKILDTRFIRIFSFFVEQSDLSIYRDEVIRRMKAMVAEAEKYGITLCHENESKIYGQMPEEVRDLLTEVKGLGGIFDAANYRMNGADITDGIEATLVNFKYLHIKDAVYKEQLIVPAGEGEGKIAEVIDRVNKKASDLVFLTLEPHLHQFMAYKDIDSHELRGRHKFENGREAFDFASCALKTLLTSNGYRKDGNEIWTK